MDVTSVATQLISSLTSNPELIAQFAQHPYSTTAQVTGSDATISKEDMSQVLAQVAAQVGGQNLAKKDTASAASALLGQSGGSVHGLASALFGGAGSAAATAGSASAAPSTAEILAKSVAGGLAARGLASLITGAMGAASKKE